MSILAVDLAAKYSAVCHLTPTGTVLSQNDSWGMTETDFIGYITADFTRIHPPVVMIVEDLPHRLPFASLVKKVCRMQGRIVERMTYLGHPDKVLFVPPAVWRKHYPELKRGTGPDAVLPAAANNGYQPPDLSTRAAAVKGGKALARKVATDYCAAYLIGLWAVRMYAEHDTFDIAGTSRYTLKEQ